MCCRFLSKCEGELRLVHGFYWLIDDFVDVFYQVFWEVTFLGIEENILSHAEVVIKIMDLRILGW